MLIGVVLGLASAAAYGAGPVFARIGMRRSVEDNGHFMMVLVTVVLLGMGMLVTSGAAADVGGVVGFVVAGVLTNALGRSYLLRSVRLIGPSRQGALVTSAPVFTAIVAWIVLGEVVRPGQALGAVIVTAGVLVLLLDRREPLGAPPTAQTQMGVLPVVDDQPEGDTGGSGGAGYVYGMIATVLLGGTLVLRKWALVQYPDPMAGAFIGSLASLPIITFTAGRTRYRALYEENLKRIPWWFVAAGVAVTAGLMLQFYALTAAPTWVVSLLQGSQGAWTLGWSSMLMGAEEPRTRSLVVSLVLVTVGVAVIAVGSR